MRFLDRLQPLGLLVLRLVLGAIMIAHGYPRAFGGLHHSVEFVHSLGMPGWMAYLSIAAELGGGVLLIVGFLTRFTALCVCIDMIVATSMVHFKNGFTGTGKLSVHPGAGRHGVLSDLLRRGHRSRSTGCGAARAAGKLSRDLRNISTSGLPVT